MYKENCPYCNAIIEIDHDDGYGYEEDETYQQECPKCEKIFVYHTTVSYSHSLHQADCLNDGQHQWESTMTFPKEFTEMRCKLCDKTREPTPEEWKMILGV